MTISYKKLWKLLIDKNMKRTDLIPFADISTSTLAKLGKNEPVKLDILMKICTAFHCDIGDVIEFVEDENAI